MSAGQVIARFRCDLCYVEQDADLPVPAGVYSWQQEPPPGWTRLSSFSLMLKDFFGSMIEHLCPACSMFSIGQVSARMTEQQKEAMASERARQASRT